MTIHTNNVFYLRGHMKKRTLFFFLATLIFALDIELTSGEKISGELIHQSKGKFTIKSGNQVISVFKRSIRSVNGESIKGKKRFTLPDSLILKNKNELTLFNKSGVPVHVKIRDSKNHQVIAEKEIPNNEFTTCALPNGTFYTTTKFNRPDSTYYITGSYIPLESDPDKFAKQVHEFLENKNFPFMKKYEREFLR